MIPNDLNLRSTEERERRHFSRGIFPSDRFHACAVPVFGCNFYAWWPWDCSVVVVELKVRNGEANSKCLLSGAKSEMNSFSENSRW